MIDTTNTASVWWDCLSPEEQTRLHKLLFEHPSPADLIEENATELESCIALQDDVDQARSILELNEDDDLSLYLEGALKHLKLGTLLSDTLSLSAFEINCLVDAADPQGSLLKLLEDRCKPI